MAGLLQGGFNGCRAEDSYGGVAEWFRQGPAKPCTRVRFPSPPRKSRAISSVGERFPDTEEATGSIPVSPTTFSNVCAAAGAERGASGSRGLILFSLGEDLVHG